MELNQSHKSSKNKEPSADHIYNISFFKDNEPKGISKADYGYIVNCVALRATISYVDDIKDNTVSIGVERASSGWTASSLATAINNYPPFSEYTIKVTD